MKFVCDRCQTRYSIADEKVRQKILRIRCKSCGNVIVVQDSGAHEGAGGIAHEPSKAAPHSSGPKTVPTSGPKGVPASGPKAGPPPPPGVAAGGPPPPPRPAKGHDKGSDRLGGHVEWYVAIDGVQSGPFSRVDAARRVMAASPDQEVNVWKEGMRGWKPPKEVSVIARELNLLRPATRKAPPTPPPASHPAPAAKPAFALVDAKTEPMSQAVSGEIDDFETPVATTIDDVFADVTTRKVENPNDPAVAFVEATTKKGKSLRDIEVESGLTPPPQHVVDEAATPPPVQPLPPIGAKAAPRTPASPAVPGGVPASARPGSPFVAPALPRAFVTTRPVAPFAAPVTPSSPATPRPVAPFAAPVTPSSPTTPRPVAPFLAQLTPLASVPAANPALATSAHPTVSPAAPVHLPGFSLAPQVAPSAGQAPGFGLEPGLASLPTPQPVNLDPFGVGMSSPMADEVAASLSPPAGVFQRQPGLKYLVAAVAIVGLIILLGMVILRSDREKSDEPSVGAGTPISEPAKPEPAKPEPAKPEPAKPEEPKEAKIAPAEAPVPRPVAQEKPSSAPGKRGGKKTVQSVGPAPERAPKQKPEPKPPRLVGARPNPFDEVKSVSQSQITAVVRNTANQAALKACYERALKMDNHITSGRMDVTVSISASGAVQRVVVNAPASFILVEPCIKNAVKRWSFPSSTEDYGTNFPLILQGGM